MSENKTLPPFLIQSIQSTADWSTFELLLRTYAQHDLDQPHLSSIWKDLEDLPARYGPPKGAAVLLCLDDQTPIGCGAIAATSLQNACEIKRLYIQPAHRGRGGSKILIQALMEKALLDGYHQAVLSTWQSNTSGLALYKSMGFHSVPSFKSHPNSELIYLGRSLSLAKTQTTQ
jgi:putative acetyltransferase